MNYYQQKYNLSYFSQFSTSARTCGEEGERRRLEPLNATGKGRTGKTTPNGEQRAGKTQGAGYQRGVQGTRQDDADAHEE